VSKPPREPLRPTERFEVVPVPAPAALPVIPDYDIRELIGRGGQGVVYRARQLSLPRVVALKLLRDTENVDPERLRDLRQEAEKLAGLQHPNVVTVHAFGLHQGCPFLTLEFVEGGSLARRLAGQPQPPRQAAELVETLARAMHAVHQRGLVHRDLKPANVLLAADGTPKITDFGLAKKVAGGPATPSVGGVKGTPEYMAWEQVTGLAEVGPRTDVYGLGATLYEMLTGRPPFQRAGQDRQALLATLRQVERDDPVPPRRLQPTVPRDLEAVCLKCLEKRPRQRYAGALELADDLRRFLEHRPTRARPPWPWERGLKWARRRPAVAGLLAAVVVLTVVGAWFGLEAQNARLNEANERALRAEDARRLSDQARAEVEDESARSLIDSLGHQEGELTLIERDALWRLAATRSERLRRRFFNLALTRADTATRLGRRAEWAVQAGVGLDAKRREDVLALVRDRLQNNQAELEVRLACVELGVALEARERAFAQAACQTLVESMIKKPDPQLLQHQVHTVVYFTELLDREQGAEVAKKATGPILDVMANTQHQDVRLSLAWAVGQIAKWLTPDQAAQATHYALEAMPNTTSQFGRFPPNSLAQAVEKLAERLTQNQIAQATHQALDLMETTANVTGLDALAQAVVTLGKRLPPPQAAEAVVKASSLLLDGLTKLDRMRTPDQVDRAVKTLAEGLTPDQAARALTPDQAARATRMFLDAMAKTRGGFGLPRRFSWPTLLQVVEKLAERLTQNQAAQATQQALDLIANTKTTDLKALSSLAEAVGSLADGLTREQVVQASQQSLDLLAKTANLNALDALAEALLRLADRLPPLQAAEVIAKARLLVLDRVDKATNLNALISLAQTGGKLGERLGPLQAAEAIAKIRPLDRFALLAKTTDASTLMAQTTAVVPLAKWLKSEEAAQATHYSLEAMRNTTDRGILNSLAQAVETMAEGLTPNEAARATDQVLDTLTNAKDPAVLHSLACVIQKLAGRLPPRQAREVFVKAGPLILDAVTRTTKITSPDARWVPGSLARALENLAERLAPDQAILVLDLLARTTSPDALGYLVQAVEKLAEGLPAPQAEEVTTKARRLVLDALANKALAKTTDPEALLGLVQAIEKLAERLTPDQAAQVTQHILDDMEALSFVGVSPQDRRALALLKGQNAAVLAVRGLAKRLTPAQASQATQRALDLIDKFGWGVGFVLVQAVKELADRLTPDQAAQATQQGLEAIAKTTSSAYHLELAVGEVAERLSLQGMVDLLKQPLLVRSGRQAVLKALCRRLGTRPTPQAAASAAGAVAALPTAPLSAAALAIRGEALYPGGRRPFTGLWEAVDWLHQHHPELDLTSPAHQLDRKPGEP
jgi:hypothetical protein